MKVPRHRVYRRCDHCVSSGRPVEQSCCTPHSRLQRQLLGRQLGHVSAVIHADGRLICGLQQVVCRVEGEICFVEGPAGVCGGCGCIVAGRLCVRERHVPNAGLAHNIFRFARVAALWRGWGLNMAGRALGHDSGRSSRETVSRASTGGLDES
eukprot:2437861-Prymnesium_polylepis.1